MLIELEGVSKRFGAVQALTGLSAAIDGRIIGLLGPNGAGKSTLLKCLLGLIPYDGQARVLGMSSRERSFAIRDGFRVKTQTGRCLATQVPSVAKLRRLRQHLVNAVVSFHVSCGGVAASDKVQLTIVRDGSEKVYWVTLKAR